MGEKLSWEDGRRMRAVELLKDGWEPSLIAEVFAVDLSTVYRWQRIEAIEGAEGLKRRYSERGGKLSSDQWTALFEMLEQGAKAHGFESQYWTLPRINALIERHFNTSYSKGHLSRVMRDKGWSPQKAATKDHRGDEEAKQTWVREVLPELEKKSSRRRRRLGLRR